MASLACSISSLKPQPINPSSHKLLGFNYLSTQLTLKLSPTHQSFYSTTRRSNNFTTTAGFSPRHPRSTGDNSPKQLCDGDHKDKIGPCIYAIKLEDHSGMLQKVKNAFNSKEKNHVSSSNGITMGVCMLWPKEKNFHFGEHRKVDVQGQCLTSEGTYLDVIGGSGIFKGVQGKVKLQKICIEAPVELFYLEGIENLQTKL